MSNYWWAIAAVGLSASVGVLVAYLLPKGSLKGRYEEALEKEEPPLAQESRPHEIHGAMAQIESRFLSYSPQASISWSEWQALKSQIGALMVKHCAGEMTEGQWEERRNQRAPNCLQRQIDAGVQRQHPS